MGEGSVEKVFPSKYVIGVNNLEMGIKSRYIFIYVEDSGWYLEPVVVIEVPFYDWLEE